MGKKNTPQYKCPHCGAITYKPTEFERHVYLKHGKHVQAERCRVQDQPALAVAIPMPSGPGRLSA